MKKNLTTTQSTDLVLKKTKSTLGITQRILSGSKNLTTKSDNSVVLSPDLMMINGLMWQKETVKETMDWDDAMEYAKNLRLGGYDDWRLPTIKELAEVVTTLGGVFQDCKNNIENKYYQACIKEQGFERNWNSHWSSSTERDAKYWRSAYRVNIRLGCMDSSFKHLPAHVRCVRTGQ